MDELKNIQQPNTQQTNNTSTSNDPRVLSNSSGGSNKIIALIVVVVLILLFIGGGFYFIVKSNQNSSKVNNPISMIPPTVTQESPYEILQSALIKTIAVKTMYLDYQTKVTSYLTSAKTGVTQTLHNSVNGSISGSKDGKTMDMEMKIFNDSNPDKSVNLSVLSTENGDWYIRNAQTAPKWKKLTKEQSDQFTSNSVDASLFGVNILSTAFSNNQALFKSFAKESVISLGDEQKDNNTYGKYKVAVSTLDYINALSGDNDLKKQDVDDARKILKDSIIDVTYFVNKNTGYVEKIYINGQKFTQISTEESQQLKISTTHDISLVATLSRFNVPTNITAPESSDVLGVSIGPVTKLSIPLSD